MTVDRVDVLIAGFGLAGAAAALTAAEAGARVLVVEKTAAGGGNCRHSGGFLVGLDGPRALEHLDALCFGKTSPEVLRAYLDGLAGIPDWVAGLGGSAPVCDPDAFVGLLPSWPHFPGTSGVTYRQFGGGGPGGTRPGIALWDLVERAVRATPGIEVRCSTAVRDLVVRDGTVCGAVLAPAGGSAGAGGGVRATEIVEASAVVLASGGMEYDPELRDTFLGLPLTPVGHPGNTGDSIRLAQGAGASLWHMGAFFGWLAFAAPGFDAAFTIDVHGPSHVLVDGDGRRFADETGWEVHDRIRCWTTYQPRHANRPLSHGFVVFDEAARLAGPLHGIVGTPNDYVWSGDNSAEVAAGWIVRGETPRELAAATGIDPDVLAETLAGWERAVVAGRDDDFNRPPDTLAGLTPPLYALPVVPGLATASGGPRRDGRARVLRGDPSSSDGYTAIPGLYAAGAAGSIWGHLTEHGGGLTDAIVFGRIAGGEAARLRSPAALAAPAAGS